MTKCSKVIASLSVAAALGVAMVPLSSYAAESQTKEITVTVGQTLGVAIEDQSTSGGLSLTIQDGGDYVDSSSSSNRVQHKVKSWANVSGYNLYLVDADTNNSLVHTTQSTNTIPAKATGASALTAGTAGWGYKVGVDNESNISSTNSWKPVVANNSGLTANGDVIRTESTITAPVTSSDPHLTYVRYGVAIDNVQYAGQYTDTVLYKIVAAS